jgi:hypothetical protein
MTTVPETAVAGCLVLGGVLLAAALSKADPNTLKVWASNSNAQNTLHCPSGTILDLDAFICHPFPPGAVDMTLNKGNKFALHPAAQGTLQVIAGAVQVDNGPQRSLRSYYPTTPFFIFAQDRIEAIQPDTQVEFRPR